MGFPLAPVVTFLDVSRVVFHGQFMHHIKRLWVKPILESKFRLQEIVLEHSGHFMNLARNTTRILISINKNPSTSLPMDLFSQNNGVDAIFRFEALPPCSPSENYISAIFDFPSRSTRRFSSSLAPFFILIVITTHI